MPKFHAGTLFWLGGLAIAVLSVSTALAAFGAFIAAFGLASMKYLPQLEIG